MSILSIVNHALHNKQIAITNLAPPRNTRIFLNSPNKFLKVHTFLNLKVALHYNIIIIHLDNMEALSKERFIASPHESKGWKGDLLLFVAKKMNVISRRNLLLLGWDMQLTVSIFKLVRWNLTFEDHIRFDCTVRRFCFIRRGGLLYYILYSHPFL